MTPLRFGVTVPMLPGSVDSCALGASASPGDRFTKNEVGKAVKLAASNNYVLAVDNDDLEGVCEEVGSSDPGGTVNNGWSFGGVRRRFGSYEATVKGGALAVGAQVRCAAQAALGTANTNGAPHIEAGTGTAFKWRVKSLLTGTGQIDQLVLIEPCTAG